MAYKVIERIRKEISELALGHGLRIQISAGVATSKSFKNMEDVLKMADKNLYKEKRVKKQLKIDKDSLKTEIEKIRNKLNELVIKNNKKNINEEVIKISQKLDELIIDHIKDE